MPLRKQSTAAATAPTIAASPGVSNTDRATWAEQADHLARKYARAEAFQWGPVVAVVIVIGIVVVYQFANVKDDDLALGALTALLAGTAIVTLRAAWVYANKLRDGADATQRATWAKEEALGEDITGDGYVGDPFNRVKVKREGETIAEVIVPHPSSSIKHEKKMEGWGVSASDLVAFVFEAERERGLNERAWVGEGVQRFSLSSGAIVTQPLFRQVLAALADHELEGKPMAAKEAQRWVLKAKAEAIARAMQP
jgi:hypothetical protein